MLCFLKKLPVVRHLKTTSTTRLLDKLAGVENNYAAGTRTRTLTPVHISLSQNQESFQNYLEYLELCWSNHWGVLLTPDIIWHTLLGELAAVVHENHKKYRHLFTFSTEKTEISVPSDSLTVLPLDKVVSELLALAPVGLADFLPTFSTTTAAACLARYGMLLDMASPYYNYSMFCCGIPFIEVRGTHTDWLKVLGTWSTVASRFPGLEDYAQRVTSLLENLIANLDGRDQTFWGKFFFMERCGSGSQVEVCGWYSDFFRKTPKVRYVENYTSQVGRIPYRQLETKKDYVMTCGLFSGQLSEGQLQPAFGCVVFEKHEPVIKSLPKPAFFARGSF